MYQIISDITIDYLKCESRDVVVSNQISRVLLSRAF